MQLEPFQMFDDLGLTIHPQHRPGLVLNITRREPLTFVCHPQHPFAARPAVCLRELAGSNSSASGTRPTPRTWKNCPTTSATVLNPSWNATTWKCSCAWWRSGTAWPCCRS